jgi:hypothetical protein
MLETTRYRIVMKLAALLCPVIKVARHCPGALMTCNNALCPNSSEADASLQAETEFQQGSVEVIRQQVDTSGHHKFHSPFIILDIKSVSKTIAIHFLKKQVYGKVKYVHIYKKWM